MVVVIARLAARSGELSKVMAALAPLVAATRAEAGCVEYLPLTRSDAPDELCLAEKWETREALEKHLSSAHIGAFQNVTGPLLLSSDVSVWEACES